MMSYYTYLKEWAMEDLQKRSRTRPTLYEIFVNKCFEHFKGGFYRITRLAKWHEDGSVVAIYENMMTGEEWVRPVDQFLQKVEVDGQEVPRFKHRPDLEV